MPSKLLHRLRHHVGRLVGPRGIVAEAAGWRGDLRSWLSTGWNAGPAPARQWTGEVGGASHLDRARSEFLQALVDVDDAQASTLLQHIRKARTLRDLWHLRPAVFKLLSIQYSQADAQLHLDLLNRHFPTRSPRSGLMPLDPPADTRPARKP